MKCDKLFDTEGAHNKNDISTLDIRPIVLQLIILHYIGTHRTRTQKNIGKSDARRQKSLFKYRTNT